MNRLTVKRLVSIGAVPSGDNPEAEIMLFKRRNPQDMTPDRASDTKDMEMSDVSKDDLDPKDEIIKELEDRIAELEAVSDEPDDITKGMSDEIREAFEAIQKEQAETAAALAKEREERRLVEWVGKARAFERILGDAEESAPVLNRLSKDDSDWLLDKLTAAEKVLEKSDLFKELGSGDDTVSATDKITAAAVEKRKENPSLTMAQARNLVRKEDPALAKAEREEK